MNLVKFWIDCGMMGSLSGASLFTDGDIDAIVEQGDFCFYEVLGKHSEIDVHISKKDLEITPLSIAEEKVLRKVCDKYGHIAGIKLTDYLT